MISPEVLRRFSLFAGLDPDMFKELAMVSEEVALSADEWLFEEGGDADALYLILSGTVELTINLDEAGKRKADLTTLVEGDVAGWSALVEPYVYTMGAKATSDTKVVKLDGEELREKMTANPEMGLLLMHHLAQALGQRLNNLRVQFISLTES